MVNRNRPIPLYIQLADTLREQIRSGEIVPGTKLPSETEMIKQYQLGRLTIRDALSILANEGLVEKRHGKGTFCKSNSIPAKYKIDVLLNLTDVYFIPYYLQAICEALENENVNIVLSDTKNNPDMICAHLEKILVEGSDGVLIQPTPDSTAVSEKMSSLFQNMITSGIPYIMIDSAYEDIPQSYVVLDEYRAGVLAAEYFTAMGHNSLCMINMEGYTDSALRMQGFAESLSMAPYCIDYSQDLFQSISVMRKERPDITGIFCYNDEIARECYQILDCLAVSIPEQISLIGVDDTVIASTLNPPLTSIIHPKKILGRDSAQALISIVLGGASWPYRKVYEPSIQVRKSCKNLRD